MVTGILEGDTIIVPGTYHAALPDAGADRDEENDVDIGLVAFIAVGMVEVSTCEFAPKIKCKERRETRDVPFRGGLTHLVLTSLLLLPSPIMSNSTSQLEPPSSRKKNISDKFLY